MALLGGSLQNVYLSIDKYLQENLVNTDGTPITVRLHGVRRFVPPVEDPWVEAHYEFLGNDQVFHRNAGPSISTGNGFLDRLSTERRGQLQLNLYQRARVFAQRYVTSMIRDLVIDAFPDGGILPIYNYAQVSEPATPLAQESLLIFDGVTEQVLDTALNSSVIEHVLTIQTRYFEEYTRVGLRV